MTFSTDFETITQLLTQTNEYLSIIKTSNDFPNGSIFDLKEELTRVRAIGAFLTENELFLLGKTLNSAMEICDYFNEENSAKYPALKTIADSIILFPDISRLIQSIIDKFGNIKDNASPQLFQLRKELLAKSNSVNGMMQRIISHYRQAGILDKDCNPAMRDGRLVIPVAPMHKRAIKGIVHDESATGKTYFIEPAEIVETNNHIRELESEIRREITRILISASDQIRPHLPELMEFYHVIGLFDFIHAKAVFADELDASMPKLTDTQEIDWYHAVHPVLFTTLKKTGKKVVPLSIKLDKKNHILLISGPNAGGKSVCLKTVGIVQYMLQCGMLVPMSEGSRMGIFGDIFLDIGDEQSIEDDLSTYSSHLLNMKVTMKRCGGTSLILIDEFGSGTEPQIGGAMAEAVLKRFNAKHAYGVITTHYQNLKHFAEENEGVVNGAMLYDRKLMRPLFELRIGNPGSSFAVEIAHKIGIPEDVIADASDIVGREYINADKYLQDIVRDKRYWENKRQAIRQHEKQMEQTISRYENEIEQLQKEKREILAKAKEQAQELLKSSNAKIEQTIKEIKEAQAEKEKTKDIRQDLADFKQTVREIDPDAMEERIRRQMEKIQARRKRREDNKNKKGSDKNGEKQSEVKTAVQEKKAFTPSVGDFVKMKGQKAIGKVVKINGKDATVAFGVMLTNVKIDALEPSKAPEKEERVATFISLQTQNEIREKKLEFRQDIDVRGMRGDEAVQAVTYFIDDALVAGVSKVRILHGTGSGILRTLIRQYLATVPAVADFHDEHVQFGGAGITVVDLV